MLVVGSGKGGNVRTAGGNQKEKHPLGMFFKGLSDGLVFLSLGLWHLAGSDLELVFLRIRFALVFQ